MYQFLPDLVYILMIIGLTIALVRTYRRGARREAAIRREQADLRRKIAQLNVELATVTFDRADNPAAQQLAKNRMELADLQTELGQMHDRQAAMLDEAAAQSFLPRWMRRRTRDTLT